MDDAIQAVREGDTTALAKLLDAGLDPNAKDSYGWTLLHWAAGAGLPGVTDLLATRGAHLNARDRAGYTPLHHAVLEANYEVVGLLRGRGAALTLETAAALGNIREVRKLLAAGARANGRDGHNWTPLHWAVLGEEREIASLLIANGAPYTLHIAAGLGNMAKVRALLRAGAKVDQHDWRGWTALHWAAWAGQADMAHFLLDKGARVNAEVQVGMRPLWCAYIGICAAEARLDPDRRYPPPHSLQPNSLKTPRTPAQRRWNRFCRTVEVLKERGAESPATGGLYMPIR